MQLSLDGEGPLYKQTYRALRTRILDGSLAAGSRLPASRALAEEAGISRNTVLLAFDQLRAEGYVTARTGSGTFVTQELPDDAIVVAAAAGSRASTRATTPLRLSRTAERYRARALRGGITWGLRRRAAVCDFRYGEPAYDDLPIATWARLVARRTRSASLRRLAYAAPGGAEELRRALAGYLAHSRGVVCGAEQIVVTYGSQQAFGLVAKVLVDRGDRVCVEEPCYRGLSLAWEAVEARLVPIPVDSGGLRVDVLDRRAPVRAVCVTPSHQFPTGALMPLSRRLELLRYAERTGTVVVEDDYDSEFRYDGRPVACLQGLDRSGLVIYLGSVSKMLFPALRVGWLVVPDSVAEAFRNAKAVEDTGTASIEQLALADLIEGGHLERHVRRTRARNSERRAALLDSIARHLGDRARVTGEAAGLHVTLWLDSVSAAAAKAVRRHCRERGVEIYPIAPYYADPPAHAGFLLGYASLDEKTIERGIVIVGAAVETVSRSRR